MILRRLVLLSGFLVAASACGGTTLSDDAAAGMEIAQDNGCMSCHGSDGSGGVGPSWVGLAGSEVSLADGSTTVADGAYLRRSITDPEAEQVESYTLKMPSNKLTEAEVDLVVAYIQALK